MHYAWHAEAQPSLTVSHCSSPAQLQFGRGEHGKPHLLTHSGDHGHHGIARRLQFNLSHTRSLLDR